MPSFNTTLHADEEAPARSEKKTQGCSVLAALANIQESAKRTVQKSIMEQKIQAASLLDCLTWQLRGLAAADPAEAVRVLDILHTVLLREAHQ